MWHVVSMPAAADSRCDRRHMHREHITVGVVDRPFAVQGTPEHTTHWVERGALDRLKLPEDTPMLTVQLFGVIGRATARRPRPAIDEGLRVELLRRQKEDQAVRGSVGRAHVRAERAVARRGRGEHRVAAGGDRRVRLARRGSGRAGSRQRRLAARAACRSAARRPAAAPGTTLRCRDVWRRRPSARRSPGRPGTGCPGQQQIFGTQLQQSRDGTPVPYPIQNPQEVEALRSVWGFEPLTKDIEQVAASFR